MNTTNIDSDDIKVRVYESPIKSEEVTLGIDDLKAQAEAAVSSLMPIDYKVSYGTCGDERVRIGKRSGEATVEARPSVFGGPDIYALYMRVLSSALNSTDDSPDHQLAAVAQRLRDAEIPPGGHEHCAAAGKFGQIIQNIAVNSEAVHEYAKHNMENYDQTLMNEVVDFARQASDSKIYEDWDGEGALVSVLGDDSGLAIERLADVPHEARTLIRNKRAGYTVDQNTLHNLTGGKDSFVHDDAYADTIEGALSGDDPLLRRRMEHAREALMVGVALAVPNQEIHQIVLT